MKKKLTQLRWLVTMLLLVTAMAMPKMAWAEITPTQPSGNGTAGSPYQIRTAAELYWFAALVKGDTSVSGVSSANTGACATLSADIDFGTENFSLIGTSETNLYEGTFDGNGYSIIVNQNSSTDLAIFGYIGTCTIMNLTVKGTINASGKYAAGFAMHKYGTGTATIEKCISDVKIESYVDGDGTHAGIIAVVDAGPLNISNSAFTGSINGSSTNSCGGFIGYSKGTSNITNSYISATFGISTTSCNIASRGSNVSVTNCYYVNDLGGVLTGMTKVSAGQMKSGEVAYLLNESVSDGTQAWFQNLSVEGGDAYPILKNSGSNTVYGAEIVCVGNIVSKSFSNSQISNAVYDTHDYDGNGFCSRGCYQPATLTTDQYDINGDGQNDEVYEIGNAGQLYWFAALVNGTNGLTQNKGANAILTNNITINKNVLLENGELNSESESSFKKWTPIGNDYNNQYTGIFDGNNKTISGLYYNENIHSTSRSYVGLFGHINGGTVSNVEVNDTYFYLFKIAGYSYISGICAFNQTGTVSNCYNRGTISAEERSKNCRVGGVCGNSYGGTVKNCYNYGPIFVKLHDYIREDDSNNSSSMTSGYIGGVVGSNYQDKNENTKIENCHNTANIMVTILPNVSNNSIENIKNVFVGGICGASNTYIKGCHNSGNVEGQNYVQPNGVGGVCGGHIGDNYLSSYYGTITNCYNTGTVKGTSEVGGICGWNWHAGRIENCYSAGSVSGTSNVGGVCGYNYTSPSLSDDKNNIIRNCYYDKSQYGGEAIGYNGNGEIVEKVEDKTSKQFANGEVCYLLNNGITEGSQVWYQTIDSEACPTLDTSNKESRTVYGAYKHGETTPICSNSQSDISKFHAHAYDSSASDEESGNHDISCVHNEQNPYTWKDTENNTNATAKCNFTCTVCNSEVAKDMTVTSDNEHPNKPVTCLEDGFYYYKATLTFNGISYNASYEKNVPKLGHDMPVNASLNSGLHIYQKVCQRNGCGELLGYYATSDGNVVANITGSGFVADALTLEDATTYDNQAVFTATDFIYTRVFSNTNWTTWYVPFELTLTPEICEKFAFSRINNVHQYDTDNNGNADKTVVESFRQTEGVTLKANYPYLVKALSGSDLDMKLNLKNVKPALAKAERIDCQSVDYTYVFTGTYNGEGESGATLYDPYTLYSDGTWQHYHSLEPMRHYLKIESRNATTSAAAFMRSIQLSVIGDEDATGIVKIYDEERRAKETYDLGGRRIPAGSQRNGFYIENGKVIYKK